MFIDKALDTVEVARENLRSSESSSEEEAAFPQDGNWSMVWEGGVKQRTLKKRMSLDRMITWREKTQDKV
jgi:hypothetical protein